MHVRLKPKKELDACPNIRAIPSKMPDGTPMIEIQKHCGTHIETLNLNLEGATRGLLVTDEYSIPRPVYEAMKSAFDVIE